MRACRKWKSDKNRKKRGIKRLLSVMLIGTVVLLVYLIVILCLLITSTFENKIKENQNSAILQEEGRSSQIGNMDRNTEKDNTTLSREELVREQISTFAREHHLSIEDYPEELIESLIANKEKEEFVFNYPLKKDTYSNQKLTECIGQSQMHLLIQWDERWGYYPYGDGVIGVVGCGPTSLSMVALHLLQDAKYTPIYMADYAMRNDYYAEGIGTAWDFMTKGARKLGLRVQEVGLDENVVMRHLRQGHPIICAMGPGDFTTTGHFIVLEGVEDGKIRIHDCNSRERSEKLWEFQEFKYQIKNMWAYSVR